VGGRRPPHPHPAPAGGLREASTDGLAADAARGYWERRGLATGPGQTVAAPGAGLLLTALLAALPGDVVLPRPTAARHGRAARLLGRRLHPVPVPAECGGVPDPFLLLETVRRARAEGNRPRVLLLSVADDPTGTAAPPELLHEVCEAADGEGMLVLSDESWRDTCHDPHETVVVSPAEMLGAAHADAVVVLAGLDPVLLPPGTEAAVARMPGTPHGRALAAHLRHILQTLHAALGPQQDRAAARVLDEPEPLREHRAAAAREHGALAVALHDAAVAAGGLCRPPTTGRHVYVDLEPVREAFLARGVRDAATLEAELVRRLGPSAAGGHRFGDDPRALRVRLATSPGDAGAAGRVRAVLTALTEGSRR
jgi:aspartate/methionine/tyrosine aminotransferase